jgi:hypothetical protein
MHLRCLLLLIGLQALASCSFGQVSSRKINTAGAEAYFKVATLLKEGHTEVEPQWQALFKTPVYQMLIAGKAIDTTALKADMRKVFISTSPASDASFSSKEAYHQQYKTNQQQLEKYIQVLHSSNTVDSVKALLYPFLPKRLQTEARFPTLFYLNYEAPEATGYGGIVINDLLHSYRIDSYKFGLLAAHEAFHATVSVAFQQALKPAIDYNANDFNLLYFLQNVSEEGIADLIDKPLLLQKSSPVHDEVRQLTDNDEALSVTYIKSLDSLLRLAFTSETVLEAYNGFPALANAFGKNGGHIPGRFMGMVIYKSGLLQKHLEAVEDPVSFFTTYNEAVTKSRSKYPIFSKESLLYLQRLKTKFWKQLQAHQ